MSVPILGSTQPPADPCAALLLDDQRLHRLANELARELYEPATILMQYGIDMETFNDRVVGNASFISYYKDARDAWHSDYSTAQRVSAKAQLLAEALLSEAHKLFLDPLQPLTGKVALLQWLGKVGNLEPKEEKAGIDKSVNVTINLSHAREYRPDQPKTIEIKGQVLDITSPGNG